MKSEDFESKMRETDPARDLTKMTEAELQQIAVTAISSEPVLVPAQKKYGRGLVAAAVAALIAVPALNGAMTADSPPIISLGEASPNQTSGALSSAPEGLRDSKMSADAMYWWGAYKFRLADGVTIDQTTGTGYQIQAREDAEQIVKNFADALNLEGLEYDRGSKSWFVNQDDYTKPQLNGYIDGSWANVWYSNPTLDAWADCYGETVSSEDGSSSSSVEECEPTPATDLPNESEAIEIANEFFSGVGINVSGLEAEFYSDEYVAWISLYGAENSYEYYSISFADGGEIYNANASLTEKVALGEYDLVDAQGAIDRANEQSDRYIKQMEEDGVYNTMPYVDGDVSTPEPAPGDGDAYEAPVFEVKTVVVTEIKLTWTMNYSEDGSALWLPNYAFYGYVEGESKETSEYPLHTVIAIVDEQIDLDSFFGFGGYGYPMPLARDLVAID